MEGQYIHQFGIEVRFNEPLTSEQVIELTNAAVVGVLDEAGKLGLTNAVTGTYFTHTPLHEEPKEPVTSKRHHVQTKGGRCKGCGGFTTYKRANTHGLCLKCETGGK